MEHDDSEESFFKRAKPTEVPFLYKYRTINSKGLDRIFTHNEIFLPDPTKFNDPFDCKPILTTHKSEFKRDQYYRNLVKKKLPHLSKKEVKIEAKNNPRFKWLKTTKGSEEFFQIFIKGFGIYSLSEIPDDILMWSHYTDSHRGVCLQFRSSKELTIFWEAYKVTYQKEYPTINVMVMGDIDQFYRFFCTKSDHWSYEQERRVIKTSDEGGPGLHYFEPDLLTGVILGAKISEDDEKKVHDWASQHSTILKIYKAELDPRSYCIRIKGLKC